MQDINCNDIGKDNGQRLSEDSSEILLTTLASSCDDVGGLMGEKGGRRNAVGVREKAGQIFTAT